MMILETPLTELADELASAPAHLALRERATIARLARVPLTRSHRAPNHASDLGLRRNDDPAEFLRDAAAAVGIDSSRACASYDPSAVADAWIGDQISEAELAGHIDVTINLAGLWDAAGHIARVLVDASRLPSQPRALTYVATALAATGDDRAEVIFKTLAEGTTASEAESAMASVRRAAWLTKRRGQHERAAALLVGLRGDLDRYAAQRRIAPGDRDALAGVTFNLEALTAVRRGQHSLAAELLDQAVRLLSAGAVAMVDEDQRRRYLAQVRVNDAQLTAQDPHRLEEASSKLDEHLEWTRAHHRESLSEAVALSGYLHYRCERWNSAAELLHEAEGLIADEGAPSRLLSVRKNLVATFAGAGSTAAAEDVMARISKDPSGMDPRTS
ncbi:hypothetical protein [Curtobacterium sp. NPDC092190]|uniref:hypothetical protein n=1 Tax=Curtobacterium sp. NPDC092190 TaxID=3363973 RepID=UPI00382174CA